MAKQGDKIINERTGQKMIFLKTGRETNGQLLEIESFNPKSDMREPIHVHPKQESSANVITGKLHFWVNGKEQIIGPGEKIIIPAGAPHFFWNEDDAEAHSIQQFSPALHIDEFFESFFALSNDGKLSDKGMPPFLQLPLMGLKHQDDIRVTSPPWAIQLITYWILAPFSYLLGYRSYYYSKNQTTRHLRT
jgi:quercetin dioxygenase-like cupin family protein